jgi:hypothetical protein
MSKQVSGEQKKLIPFDDYYEMLKEFVTSSEARETLAAYNAEVKRYHDEGGDASAVEEDEAAYNARMKFNWSGEKIWQAKQAGRPGMFIAIGEMLIEGGWPQKFGDRQYDINNKQDVLEFVRGCAENPEWAKRIPVDLGGDQ